MFSVFSCFWLFIIIFCTIKMSQRKVTNFAPSVQKFGSIEICSSACLCGRVGVVVRAYSFSWSGWRSLHDFMEFLPFTFHNDSHFYRFSLCFSHFHYHFVATAWWTDVGGLAVNVARHTGANAIAEDGFQAAVVDGRCGDQTVTRGEGQTSWKAQSWEKGENKTEEKS